MKVYRLYSSGIHYATFFFEEGGRVHQEKRCPQTALFEPREALTQEENARWHALTRIDFLALSARLAEFEERFAGDPDPEVRLSGGEVYQRGEPDMYMQRLVKFPLNAVTAQGRLVGFVCPNRENVNILIEEGFEDVTILAQWKKAYPDERVYPVRYAGMTDIPMRDGVKLSTDVYLPDGVTGKVPAILIRTPYGKQENCESYFRFVQRGYAVVIQDVRGRNLSEGEWLPNYYEVEDGDDTITYIAKLDWCTGKVGMIGGSYLGYVQWAAAASGNPHLCALVSIVCAGSAFVDLPRRGGSFTSGMMAWAFAVSQKKMQPQLMERADWEDVLNIRPLTRIARQALGYDVPFMDKWLQTSDYNAFWERSNWSARSKGAQIPALIVSGWFDDNGMGTTEALELVHGFPPEKRRVILGPWQHSGNTRYDIHGVPFGNNALRFDLDLNYVQWFDRHLKGIQNGMDEKPRVEYYTVGSNEWKTAENWPVPQTAQRALYLHSGGNANTSAGDGRLCFAPVAQEQSDGYDYDPRNPATHIIDMSENEIEVPEDYTEQEQRADILCYTTGPLTEDITITGDITAYLFVSSDAPDTDFIVRVTDVDGQGTSIKLCDGLLSARYRDGFEKSVFMEPGQVYGLKIRTTKISNTFRAGHRIRLTVTSSAKNFIFPNSNTREGYNSPVTVAAHNVLHHGGPYPSRIEVRQEP